WIFCAPLDGVGEGLRIREIKARHGPHHDEPEEPEPQRAVQPPGEALTPLEGDPQAAPPALDGGPPDHRARHREYENQTGSKRVRATPRPAEQQVVMKVEQPRCR